jgi:hypothetical protein
MNSSYDTYIQGNAMKKFPVFWFLLKQRIIYVFSNNENEKVREFLLDVGTGTSGEDIKKEHRMLNMVEILCTHV